jgi:hypothetical protein
VSNLRIDALVEPSASHGLDRRPVTLVAQDEHQVDLYKRFWAAFLERVHAERPGWTKARIPTDVNWMTMPAPIKGAVIGMNFAQKGQLRTELYIDSGDGDMNMKIFDELQSRQTQIESVFGEALSWEDLSGKRSVQDRCLRAWGRHRDRMPRRLHLVVHRERNPVAQQPERFCSRGERGDRVASHRSLSIDVHPAQRRRPGIGWGAPADS